MTVTYSLEVSQARVGGFLKLLFRWKGSIYRLLYKEMLIFILLYYSILVVYRFLLDSQQRRIFELLSWYMKDFTELVPITFVLGFYVALVVKRWWDQYLAIPWVDRAGMQVGAYVQGADEKGRLVRRAMVRYLNLMGVLTFRGVSTTVMRRFPTMDHVEEAGLMTAEEQLALDEAVAPHGNWWVPGQWFAQLAMAARKEGRIHDDLHLKSLIDEMLIYRGGCGALWSHDWISIPLVYTQVVTIAVYSFFTASLFGRQYLYHIPAFDKVTSAFVPLGGSAAGNGTATPLASVAWASLGGSEEPNQYVLDYYVPVFTLFQFFFYMGWLKVAEEMICPFGEDDDDFELNWIIDRNVQVGYAVVDKLFGHHPRLIRDVFWDESVPDVPYTAAAASFKTGPFLGSAAAMPLETGRMKWDKAEERGQGSGPPSPAVRRRLRQTSITEEDEPSLSSIPLLGGLLRGNSRLSLALSSSKSSLMSVARKAVRSPSLFFRKRSGASAHFPKPFRKKRASEISPVYSAKTSTAGSLLNMAKEDETARGMASEQSLVQSHSPSDGCGSDGAAGALDWASRLPSSGGQSEEAGQGEELGGPPADLPAAAEDLLSVGSRLRSGVHIPAVLREEPDEATVSPAKSLTSHSPA